MEKIKRVPKVWGEEIWMANTEKYCGKLLYLKKGKMCSIHSHKKKDETFYILEGKVLMELWENPEKYQCKMMVPEEAIRIKKNVKHRFSGLENSVIIEISTHHEDSDSYRDFMSGDVPKEILEKYF